MIESLKLIFISISLGQWVLFIGVVALIYWLGSLVGWWPSPCFCKIAEDWVPLQTPVRRKKNWDLVPVDESTPRKIILWNPSDLSENRQVLHEFAAQLKSGRIMRTIVKSLPDHPEARASWLHAVKMSHFILLRPLPAVSCVGWAQVADPAYFQWFRCLLGLERIVIGRGAFTASICGHELVHLTQQVRARELTKEWGMPPEWEREPAKYQRPTWLGQRQKGLFGMWLALWGLPILHELHLELEAHWRFKLPPALLVIIGAALLLFIQYGLPLLQTTS